LYAFDADGLSSAPLWEFSFINRAAGITSVPPGDTACCDIAPEIGITGTLYVVAKTKEVSGSTTSYVQRLHALDITTDAEKLGGPVVIQASVPGTGDGAHATGHVPFLSLRENQREALLNGGVLHASHGDNPAGGSLLLPDQPGFPPAPDGRCGQERHHLRRGPGQHRTLPCRQRQPDRAVDPKHLPQGWHRPWRLGAPVYKVTSGLLSTTPVSRSSLTYACPGAATLAISAIGASNGILWAIQRPDAASPGVLHAYDTTNLQTKF
jgi:hypothetical protein